MLTAATSIHAHRHGPAHFGLSATYMSNDNNDRHDTLATPPPSADDIVTSPHASEAPIRDTMPPGAADAAATRANRTMLPPEAAPQLDERGFVQRPSSMTELLYNQLMRSYHQHQEYQVDLFDPNGRFAKLQLEHRKALVNELTEALSPRVGKLESTVVDLQARLAQVEALFGTELRDIKTAITTLMLEQGVEKVDALPAAPSLSGKVLLIAEDNEGLARIITRVARREGAHVITAATRAESEKLCAARRPDLAVVDISLGTDDGIDLASWLEAQQGLRRTSVLLMTGHIEDHDAQRARRLGLKILAKPFELSSLVAALKEALVTQPAQSPRGT